MHALGLMLAHALVYIGVWQLVRHYHLSPWLVLAAGVVFGLLFRRQRGRRGLDGRRGRRRGSGD